MNYLKGRINRATFWLSVGMLVLLIVLIRVFAPSSAHISEVVLMFLAIPRLHDIGRTGWWVLAAFGIEIAAIIVGFVVVPQHALAVAGGVTLLIFGLMTWLGAIPGNTGPNRYGDQPPPGLQWGRTTNV